MAPEPVEAAPSVAIPGPRPAGPAARAGWRPLELEASTSGEFDDPALEWRRLFSEILGTFLLVMAGAGGAVVNAVSGGQVSRTAAVAAPGLTVMAIILFMGGVSGAHLNPVVSIAFGLRRDFPWRPFARY